MQQFIVHWLCYPCEYKVDHYSLCQPLKALYSAIIQPESNIDKSAQGTLIATCPFPHVKDPISILHQPWFSLTGRAPQLEPWEEEKLGEITRGGSLPEISSSSVSTLTTQIIKLKSPFIGGVEGI